MGLFDSFKKTASKSSAGSPSASKPTSAASDPNSLGDRSEGAIQLATTRVIDRRLLFLGVGVDWFHAIKNDLARLESTWDCQLAATADEVKVVLQRDSFQALIVNSSVAAELPTAEALKDQSSAKVRIVLSAGGDKAEAARWNASGVNLLPQTTDGAALSANINRLARVQEWMSDQGMKKLLGHCRKLPAIPRLYSQVTAELASPNASIDAVAHLIAQDPVMTAKLLQVVNSAFFALGRELTNATEAVIFLGAERTRSLILLAGVFTQFESVKCPGFSAEQTWNHSLQVAALARTVAITETRSAKIAEAAFTAGLVHDVAKLILAANVPAMYQGIEQLHASKQLTQREAELQVLGTTHAELGACLMGTWGVSLPVLEAVAWHHIPAQSSERGFTLTTAVHAANIFAYEMGCGSGGNALPEKFDHAYLDQIGLGDRRNDWRKACNIPEKLEEDAEQARCRARRAAKIN